MSTKTRSENPRWRWNAELRVARREVEGRAVVVLHDPRTSDYYQLGVDEYEVARAFDGARDLEDVLRVCREFAPGLDREQLEGFASQLAESGLLVRGDLPAATEDRPQPPAPVAGRSSASRLLHVDIAAFEAGDFFARTVGAVRPLLGRPALALAAGLVVLAFVVTISNAGSLRDAVRGLFVDVNLLELWAVYALVVLLHELAHGYVCAHLGGRVSKLGFLLMYGKPCAYCDVSDAWLLSKSSRLWIMAAGSLLEVVLWALATLAWRVLAPETVLHELALLLLTLCGLGTLFNFNPLIRFDGYYMLSDGLEIPNLRQRAFSDLERRLLGRGSLVESARERRIFLVYGVVAVAYTALLVGVLLVALHRGVAERWGGGGLVLLWSVIAVVSLRPTGAFLRKVATAVGAKRSRRARLGAVALAVVAALVLVRWPLKVGADCQTVPRARVVLRSAVDGTVETVHAREGDVVSAGDVLVHLATRDLDFALAAARAEVDELEARLELLESGPRRQEIELAQQRAEEAATRVRFLRLEHERAAASLESGLVAVQQVESVERELRVAEDEEAATRKALELVEAGARPEERRAMAAQLDAVRAEVARLEDERSRTRIQAAIGGQLITAHPEHLVGRFVERGDSLLVLADLDTMVLEIPVPEKDVADVVIGARVRFKPRSEPGRTFEGRVVAIAPAAEVGGRQRTVLVRSVIDNADASLRAGTTGYAKIYCGDRRLGSILARRSVRALRTEFWALW